jgi:hypothetical protein
MTRASRDDQLISLYVSGLSYAECAEALGVVSRGWVARRLWALRHVWGKNIPFRTAEAKRQAISVGWKRRAKL